MQKCTGNIELVVYLGEHIRVLVYINGKTLFGRVRWMEHLFIFIQEWMSMSLICFQASNINKIFNNHTIISQV